MRNVVIKAAKAKQKPPKKTPLERAIAMKETQKRRLAEKVAARESELAEFKAECAKKSAALDEVLRKLKA